VQTQKEIQEYTVQAGDTIASIAQNFEISSDTILWANELTKSSKIKVGQTLVILPTSGLLYIVKSGDMMSDIAKKYKVNPDDIVSFNSLSNQTDIYIGDILIVPGGVMPQKAAAPLLSVQTQLADNFFIFPTQGKITQGLHFFNAVDTANKCGTPIYAAAGGVVQRVRYGWNYGGGNNITILHSSGVVTYYGHVMTAFVTPGQKVDVGDRIALMGGGAGMAGAGLSTGCHMHFEVIGAKNPLSKYPIGTQIKY
jgi:murein DD-endopeptidase MepM/ murein hydrolase activator NlpD